MHLKTGKAPLYRKDVYSIVPKKPVGRRKLGTCKIPDPEPLVGGVGTKQN
jgi:hypothetical protein